MHQVPKETIIFKELGVLRPYFSCIKMVATCCLRLQWGESIPLVLLPGQKRKQMLRTIFPGNSLLDG